MVISEVGSVCCDEGGVGVHVRTSQTDIQLSASFSFHFAGNRPEYGMMKCNYGHPVVHNTPAASNACQDL